MKVVGSKYLTYTRQFREMHDAHRITKIKNIMETPRSNLPFESTFPLYDTQYTWKYKDMALHAYYWQKDNQYMQSQNIKAILINFNALNAHMGLSGRMAHALGEAGIVMTGVDYPNFGKSQSPNPGHIQSVPSLVQLSEKFVEHIVEKHPGTPIYLHGLSMGGLIAFQVGLRRPTLVNGCIFVNPAFRDNPANNSFLKKVMMLGGLLLPKFKTMKPMKSHSTRHSLQKYKKNDSLMYTGKVWTSTTWALLSNMRKIAKQEHFEQFQLPFLCIQGGTDKILNPFTVFELEKLSKSVDKQIVIIPDLWHALWFDDHHDEVTQMIKNWILYRIQHKQINKTQAGSSEQKHQQSKCDMGQPQTHGRHVHHPHSLHQSQINKISNQIPPEKK